MVDLQGQYKKIENEIMCEIRSVLNSAQFVRGEKITLFQHNLERYLHVKHVIPVGNGTDALQIALMSLHLPKNAEVIVPSFSFVSAAEVVSLLGYTPCFIDVDKDTFCMCARDVENAITERTKAIIPVHLFGQNADMENIVKIAQKHNLYVIEDACQSIGAVYQFSNGIQAMSGCMGDFGCVSFFPSKNLGCYGDGGALFTNSDELAETARCIANHGSKEKYHYECVGVNSRLDTLQAAILDVKLAHLEEYIAKRQHVAALYDAALQSNKAVQIPKKNPQSRHTYHQYTVQLDKSIDRNLVRSKMQTQGVPTMVYYPRPLHYDYNPTISLPISEQLSETVLSLPMHTELEDEQILYIVNTLQMAIKTSKK